MYIHLSSGQMPFRRVASLLVIIAVLVGKACCFHVENGMFEMECNAGGRSGV